MGRAASKHLLLRCALVIAACCAGCEDEDTPDDASAAHPLAGLFTPGSKLGVVPGAGLDASVAPGDAGSGLTPEELAEIERAIDEADGMNRCARPPEPDAGVAATPGMLVLEFHSESYGGFYAPLNCGVVWIEDSAGRYVATPLLWAGLRSRNLFIWDALRCEADRPDAISSATLDDHSMPHVARWDGQDILGEVVPDGTYVVNVEVSEDEFNYGRRAQFPFEKGAEPVMQQPEDQPPVLGLTLTYTPRP